MTCAEVVGLLYEYLDRELNPESTALIREHLQQCSHCFKYFDFEHTYLKFVESRMRARGAPPEVRDRLLRNLMNETATEGGQ